MRGFPTGVFGFLQWQPAFGHEQSSEGGACWPLAVANVGIQGGRLSIWPMRNMGCAFMASAGSRSRSRAVISASETGVRAVVVVLAAARNPRARDWTRLRMANQGLVVVAVELRLCLLRGVRGLDGDDSSLPNDGTRTMYFDFTSSRVVNGMTCIICMMFLPC